jgi:hypothetical protein
MRLYGYGKEDPLLISIIMGVCTTEGINNLYKIETLKETMPNFTRSVLFFVPIHLSKRKRQDID